MILLRRCLTPQFARIGAILSALTVVLLMTIPAVHALDFDLEGDDDFEQKTHGFVLGVQSRLAFNLASITSGAGTIDMPQVIPLGGGVALEYYNSSFSTRFQFSAAQYTHSGLTGFTPEEVTGLRLSGELSFWAKPWHDGKSALSQIKLGIGGFFFNRSYPTATPFTLIGDFTEVGLGVGARTAITLGKFVIEPEILGVLPGYFSGVSSEFGPILSSIHFVGSAKVFYVFSSVFRLGLGVLLDLSSTRYGASGSRPLENATDTTIEFGFPIQMEISL